MKKITETASPHRHLEKMSLHKVLTLINDEDLTVAQAVCNAIPYIEALIEAISSRLKEGGRLFYIGAGTSGRLGILDASEWSPTFGVAPGLVIGIIAGGSEALSTAVEFAEDDREQGWKDLQGFHVSPMDFVVGLSASGTTPYVIKAVEQCKANSISTGGISCNPRSLLSETVDFPVEIITGPEFLTGSTRMKAGTAQKMVLNMVSTAVMIQLGRVEDNKMINMQLNNEKLIDRGVHMLMEKLTLSDYNQAKSLLLKYGSVKTAVKNYRS